jgi:thioredoxin-related protein
MAVKFRFYTALCALLIASICAAQAPARAAAAPAEIEVPAWFKVSFLDLRDDLKEATAGRKRLVLYFGQNGCPYCKRLMEVNFTQPGIVAKTRRHFDMVEINIFGSREVSWLDGKTRSEKELAALLKVQFTPTLCSWTSAAKLRCASTDTTRRRVLTRRSIMCPNDVSARKPSPIIWRARSRPRTPRARAMKRCSGPRLSCWTGASRPRVHSRCSSSSRTARPATRCMRPR